MDRRNFLAMGAASAAFLSTTTRSRADETSPAHVETKILKSLKIGMVGVEGTLTDKFKAAQAAGFDGIELNAPGFDVGEVRQAIEATDLPVDGTVCATHWGIRHTSPDAEQRARALADLQQAIRDTHAVGGHTVLLVIGRGSDGPESEIIPRSQANIAKAIPLAAELGVYIAIENVWNQMLYEHDGPSNQSADRFVEYVDAFRSPWVGMQFDIGNHWKYGDPAEWIRTLGSRIVKLDAKGFSRANDRFTQTMTEGDLDWAAVRQALDEIGFAGWAAAEVGGGDMERLREISRDMDKAFGLG
jgi:hexulose-6-phosphate isomerase